MANSNKGVYIGQFVNAAVTNCIYLCKGCRDSLSRVQVPVENDGSITVPVNEIVSKLAYLFFNFQTLGEALSDVSGCQQTGPRHDQIIDARVSDQAQGD